MSKYVYISWKFVQYTIHWAKTQMLKTFPSDKKPLQKMHLFFLCELLITDLLLMRNSYLSWSTWYISLKLCAGFSIFDSVLFLLYFIFLLNKKHGLFDLKRHNSFQNKNHRTVLLPDLWFLSSKKKLQNSVTSARIRDINQNKSIHQKNTGVNIK